MDDTKRHDDIRKHILVYDYEFTFFSYFIFETSSDCEESNVYHLKKYPFHPGRVARMCLCTCFVK